LFRQLPAVPQEDRVDQTHRVLRSPWRSAIPLGTHGGSGITRTPRSRRSASRQLATALKT
jgi:hypothetical protein